MAEADLRSDETKYWHSEIDRAVARERERCAKLVPTNWLDPLLTGKDAPKLPLDGPAVENLLRRLRDRIRAEVPVSSRPNTAPEES